MPSNEQNLGGCTNYRLPAVLYSRPTLHHGEIRDRQRKITILYAAIIVDLVAKSYFYGFGIVFPDATNLESPMGGTVGKPCYLYPYTHQGTFSLLLNLLHSTLNCLALKSAHRASSGSQHSSVHASLDELRGMYYVAVVCCIVGLVGLARRNSLLLKICSVTMMLLLIYGLTRPSGIGYVASLILDAGVSFLSSKVADELLCSFVVLRS